MFFFLRVRRTHTPSGSIQKLEQPPREVKVRAAGNVRVWSNLEAISSTPTGCSTSARTVSLCVCSGGGVIARGAAYSLTYSLLRQTNRIIPRQRALSVRYVHTKSRENCGPPSLPPAPAPNERLLLPAILEWAGGGRVQGPHWSPTSPSLGVTSFCPLFCSRATS